MKKIDLSNYKMTQIYFNFFDIYFKEHGIKKEFFLLDNDITPSTYRQCRKMECKIGHKIIKSLALKFLFKIPTDKVLDEIEELINNIYFDMYYKNYKFYNVYLETIDKFLKENYIIFPVLELVKLFLKISSNESISVILSNNEELFNRVRLYTLFYNESLMEIYELLYLSFEQNIKEDYWIKNYNNASAYFILASRSYIYKRYIETLFFAAKCKEILYQDGNVNRILYLNNTIMSSLIHVGNFEECYIVAFKQLKSLESLDLNDKFLLESCKKFFVISMLGKKDYNSILKRYTNEDTMNLTEILCVLISLHEKGINDKNLTKYEEFYNELEVDKLDEEYAKVIILLNKFLLNKRKNDLYELLNLEIMQQFKKILEIIVN